MGTLHGSNIPTQRLPTNRAVLQRFDILRDSMPNTSTHVFSELLYNEVLPIWQRANIPVVDKRLCTFRIEELLKSWTKNNCRKMVEGSQKEEEYVNMLNSLCSMTYSDPEDVKKELKKDRLLQKEEGKDGKRWELDFEFLLNQMKHPQIGTIGCEDLIFAQQKSVQITKELSRAKVKEKTEREREIRKEQSSKN